ncbi:MAG: acyl-CoA dehydrogenase family protein, partial [Planctomycetales bacterium]
ANMLPWGEYRKTYGAAIAKRELVQRRIGRLAGYIAGCDALVDWCSWLLDEGYRGELECTIAKIFGSEVQKDASIELFMKTHGGRAFMHGHPFGDFVHEVLAPCIYEGESEMLGMAFFKTIVKGHGVKYFAPVGEVLAAANIRKPNPLNPSHAWALRNVAAPYLGWMISSSMKRYGGVSLPKMPSKLESHARFAATSLAKSRLEISGLMRKYALGLADRQCLIADLSLRIQNLVTMLVTSLWGARQSSPISQAAADVLCQDLRRSVTGGRPDGKYFRAVTKLGEAIVDGEYEAIAGMEPFEIMYQYDSPSRSKSA